MSRGFTQSSQVSNIFIFPRTCAEVADCDIKAEKESDSGCFITVCSLIIKINSLQRGSLEGYIPYELREVQREIDRKDEQKLGM